MAKKQSTGTDLINVDAEIEKEIATIRSRIGATASNNLISTKNKMFKLPNGIVHPGPLEVVIIEWVSKNFFYPRKFKEGDVTPPSCFAIGQDIESMVPSTNSPDQQNGECASCANNQFGSSGDGKACKNMRTLAVIAANDDTVGDDAPSIYLLNVSPTGLKRFDGYIDAIAARFRSSPIKVITHVSFVTDSDYPTLEFSYGGPNSNYKRDWNRRAEALQLLQAEPNLTARTAAAKPMVRPPKGAAFNKQKPK